MKFKKLIECFSVYKKNKKSYKNGSELAQKNNRQEANIYDGLKQKEIKEYSKLVHKILDGEITLSVLKDVSQLKKEEKQKFLADIEDMVFSDRLHELNQKIIENAIDLSSPEDTAFLLRRGEDAVFRDLLYLEAKRNNSSASIDEKGTLVIKLSSTILKHYQVLINSFYKPKFDDSELLKIYEKLVSNDFFVSISHLADSYMPGYIEKSIAHSIMVLFVSNIFMQDIFNKETNPIKIQKFAGLDRDLNDLNSEYFKGFKNSEFIEDILNQINIQGEITITFETL